MGPAGRPSVVDVAFPSGAGVIPDASSRAKAIQRLRLGDIAFRFLTKTAAIGVLIILGGVLFSLIEGSLPALQAFGIDFLLEQRWNPVTEKFGALAPIYGTLVTSLIAMAIYSWQLALVTTVIMLPIIPIMKIVQKRQLRAYDLLRTRVGETLSEISEAVSGIRVIRAYGDMIPARRRLHGALVAVECR